MSVVLAIVVPGVLITALVIDLAALLAWLHRRW
jgi:hypothetical protein